MVGLIQKACPVVTRTNGEELEILLFQHPLAGVQLVKGTVETTDDSFEAAAIRELKEESGIDSIVGTKYLTGWDSGYENQYWHFVLCHSNAALPDSWVFHTLDDGGHDFEFFWHKLNQPVDFYCQPVFLRALEYLQHVLRR